MAGQFSGNDNNGWRGAVRGEVEQRLSEVEGSVLRYAMLLCDVRYTDVGYAATRMGKEAEARLSALSLSLSVLSPFLPPVFLPPFSLFLLLRPFN
eukprot:794974-Rhodomonas_salina.1